MTIALEIERIEGDVEQVGDTAGITGVLSAAASFLVRGRVTLGLMSAARIASFPRKSER